MTAYTSWREKSSTVSWINTTVFSYSIGLDEWTGVNSKHYIGCLITYIKEGSLEINLLFKELRTGTAENIKSIVLEQIHVIGLDHQPFTISPNSCSTVKLVSNILSEIVAEVTDECFEIKTGKTEISLLRAHKLLRRE